MKRVSASEVPKRQHQQGGPVGRLGEESLVGEAAGSPGPVFDHDGVAGFTHALPDHACDGVGCTSGRMADRHPQDLALREREARECACG